MAKKNWKNRRETGTGATRSSTYATRTVLRSNTSLRRDKRETNDKNKASDEWRKKRIHTNWKLPEPRSQSGNTPNRLRALQKPDILLPFSEKSITGFSSEPLKFNPHPTFSETL